MRRRHLLAALAGTVSAGCAGLLAGPGSAAVAPPPNDRTLPSTTATPSSVGTDATAGDGWLPDRSVVDLRTVGRTLALAPSGYATDDRGRVELGFAAPATDDHPTVVRATLTNLNDFENTFRLHETPPFDPTAEIPPRTYGGRLGLFLVPTENHPLRRTEPDYARTADGRWLLADGDDLLPETVTLGPGETVRSEYHLVGHPDDQGPPRGRYEIAPEFALGLTAWQSDAPGPAGDSRFAGADVPALPVDGPVAWFHDAGPETPVYVEPATERAGLPATLGFVLHNHSRTALECESFAVYREDDDGWRELASGYAHNACVNHPSGDRTAFWLRAFAGDVSERLPGNRALTDVSVSPGRFAFTLTYDETYASLFELGGAGCPTWIR